MVVSAEEGHQERNESTETNGKNDELGDEMPCTFPHFFPLSHSGEVPTGVQPCM